MIFAPLLALLATSVLAAPVVLDKRALLALPPDADSFYAKPDDLSSHKPGDVINSRSVVLDAQLLLFAKSAEQVVYKTTDLYGKDSWSIATVITPQNPQADAKVLSYQFWEDATELNCSPSYSLLLGARAPDGVTAIIDTAVVLKWALLNGYYVVVADHEGPNSAFFSGPTEGQAGLDGIRAALSRLTLKSDTPVALYGYSGGAHASVWMSELHEHYAPELNLVAAAHGGTPVDTKANLEYLDGKTFSGFILGALAGFMNADPDLRSQLEPDMKDSLKKDVGVMKADTFCVLDEIVAFGSRTFHTEFDVDLYSFPPFQKVLQRETVLQNSTAPISTPKFPRYIFHAQSDDIIPFQPVQQYVDQQCSSGANIEFVKFKGDDHITIEIIGLPGALQFIQQAFDGKLPQVACGQQPDDVLTIFSDGVSQIIGQPIADALKALEGVVTPFGKIIFSGI